MRSNGIFYAFNTVQSQIFLIYGVYLTNRVAWGIIITAVHKFEVDLKQNVAIMDFGTSKITVLIGSRGRNNSICIDGVGICEYDGFCGGTWLGAGDPVPFAERAIKLAEDRANADISKLYIGVPGDFSACYVNEVSMALNKRRKITALDVEALQEQGNEYDGLDGCKVINIEPIYYTLDDGHKLIAPVGIASTKLGGSISYILADVGFIETASAAAYSAGIADVEFVSQPLAQTLFLFDGFRRDKCVMLADVGALCTTIAIGRGDGLCRQYYFPWGGDRITVALSVGLVIPYEEADELKRKAVLSLDPDYKEPPPPPDPSGRDKKPLFPNGTKIIQTEYEIEINNERHVYPVAKTNEIIKNELKKLVMYVEKTLKLCDYKYPAYTPLSVTGGGINHIRGAAEFVASELGRDVETVKTSLPMPELDRPEHSSALGLMDMVLSSVDTDVSVVDKFKRWLNRKRG